MAFVRVPQLSKRDAIGVIRVPGGDATVRA
jgi:hypothetical protein